MVNEAARQKGIETRQRHAEARTQLWQEQRQAVETARKALLRVMEREDTTPGEIIEAARLLVQIAK